MKLYLEHIVNCTSFGLPLFSQKFHETDADKKGLVAILSQFQAVPRVDNWLVALGLDVVVCYIHSSKKSAKPFTKISLLIGKTG